MLLGPLADTLGKLNPIRYRGYFYDTETGFYFLKSRYYDPETCRFINADEVGVVTVSPDSANYDKNLYAYCDNNPVTRADESGAFWEAVAIGFVVGCIGQYVSDVIGNIKNKETGANIFKATSSKKDYLASGIGGAIAAIPGLKLVGTMAVGAVGSVVTDSLKGNIETLEDLGKSALKGAVANGIGYGVTKGISALKVNKISNMSRCNRKTYLRDNFYCNSQKNVNTNLRTFANSSFSTNMGIIENKNVFIRSGVYSTVTSTFFGLF